MKKLKRRLERLEAAVPPADEEAERLTVRAFLGTLTNAELDHLGDLLDALEGRYPEGAGGKTALADALLECGFQEEAAWVTGLWERFLAGQGGGPGAA